MVNTKCEEKQQAFVLEYLVDFNATRAATAVGVPKASAAQTGSHWLRQPEVNIFLEEEIKKLRAKRSLSVGRIIDELMSIAFADMDDFTSLDSNGERYIDLAKTSPEGLKAMTSFEQEVYWEPNGDDQPREVKKTKFRLADKLRALDMIGKYMRMFPEQVEHSGPEGGPIEVSDASDRLRSKLGI